MLFQKRSCLKLLSGNFVLLLFLHAVTNINLYAGLKIEINKGDIRPQPIAVVPFASNVNFDGQNVGILITNIIENDLQGSGLFLPIDHQTFIQDPNTLLQNGPRLADWRLLKTNFLLFGEVISLGAEKIQIKFRLFDVMTGTEMLGLSIDGNLKKWRYLAHFLSDSIYKRITSNKGYFSTQVIFVESINVAKNTERKKRLMRMDIDGFNPEPLTDGKDLVLMPSYSPDGKTIAFVKFINKEAHVCIMDLATKAQTKLGQFSGINFAPKFSPDSKKIIFSIVKEGLCAIYLMDLLSRQLTQLTDHSCIDTSPCFSPDGQKIVFTSDRSGTQQLYIMDMGGSNLKRISWDDNANYSQPVWSPGNSDLIAFTKKVKGFREFCIGVMKTDGSEERVILSKYLVERPQWSPGGTDIICTVENDHTDPGQLYKVSQTGHYVRPLKTNGKSSTDGAWSPSPHKD